MKRFLSLVLSCLMLLTLVNCGGASYWTYTANNVQSHITHPTYIPVWVDQTFTGSQVEEIRAAVKEWDYVLNGHIHIYLVEKQALGIDKKMHTYPDSFASYEEGKARQKQCEETGLGWVIYNLPSTNKHLDKGTGGGVLAFVMGEDTHAVTVVSDRFGSRSMKDIMMHEFAHLLGAEHVNAPSLEYPYYGKFQYSCIDKITVAQIAKEQDIPMEDLNYCITPNFE